MKYLNPQWNLLPAVAEEEGVTVTPNPVSCIAATLIGGIILGSVAVTPAPASTIAERVNPAVIQSSISVTPSPSACIATGVDPIVIAGSLNITPTPVSLVAAKVDPIVVLGSTSVTPSPISCIASVVDPIVIEGGVAVTPAPVSCIAEIVNPTVILGSVSLTPTQSYCVAVSVDPTVFAGVTEAIKTVKSSGGDYTSLSAFDAGEQRNLVTADEIAVAECYAFEDGTAVDINGWTTDSTRYIKIYTPTSERHDGKWDATAYRLSLSNPSAYILILREDYIRVEGLQLYQQSDTASGILLLIANAGEIQISHNILRGTPATTSGRYMFNLSGFGPNGTVKIWNNLFYDGRYGIRHSFGSAGNTYIVYNNTVVDVEAIGIQFSDSVGDVTLYLKNNLVQGTDTNYTVSSFTSFTHSNNLSEDATSPDATYRSKVVTFENEGADDFHLGSGDTEARDNGTDLSTDPDGQLSFSDDIDGDTR
jgi:hypothetical protein